MPEKNGPWPSARWRFRGVVAGGQLALGRAARLRCQLLPPAPHVSSAGPRAERLACSGAAPVSCTAPKPCWYRYKGPKGAGGSAGLRGVVRLLPAPALRVLLRVRCGRAGSAGALQPLDSAGGVGVGPVRLSQLQRGVGLRAS